MRVNNPDADPLRSILMRYARRAQTATTTAPRAAATTDAIDSDSTGATAPSGGIVQENLSPARSGSR